MKKKKVAEGLKKKIVEESFKDGAVVTQVADSYGVSVKTLSGWRRKFKEKNLKSEPKNRFVELSLAVENESPIFLKKVELVFGDLSVLIEGRVSSSKILSIIKILEESC